MIPSCALTEMLTGINNAKLVLLEQVVLTYRKRELDQIVQEFLLRVGFLLFGLRVLHFLLRWCKGRGMSAK